jgi:biotin carboxyl carrier protein
LLILEAMKMENEIRAPRGGAVQQIAVQPGQGFTLNDLLVVIA